MSLSTESVQNIKGILDNTTADPKSGVPGLVFCAVDKSGKTLVEHAAGTTGVNSKDPVDMDTIFWIASMTKIVTTIACMQLVEQGKMSLDDASFVAKHAPEIGKKLVYADGVHGVKQEKEVTLRMLLAHTAGFAYAFFDPRVSMQGRPVGIDEFTGDAKDYLESPMVNQPGTMWEYGINIDWAGILVERVTGLGLNEYFQKHIFEPLGVKDVTMFPTKDMQKRLAYMHQRDNATGMIGERDHIYHRACKMETEEQKKGFFNSGGAGLFAKPKEYLKVLTALLNNGQCPTTGHRLLSEQTVNSMWENQIPEHPNFARGGPPPPQPLLANHTPEMYPQSGDPPQGWGLSFFLTIQEGDTGRGKNTAWWAGLANLFWWVDREKGVAGVIASQILPFGDPKVLGAWVGVEKAIYDGLGK